MSFLDHHHESLMICLLLMNKCRFVLAAVIDVYLWCQGWDSSQAAFADLCCTRILTWRRRLLLLSLLYCFGALSPAVRLMEVHSDHDSEMLIFSPQSLNTRLQAVEHCVKQCTRRIDDVGDDVKYLMNFKKVQTKLLTTLHGKIKEQQQDILDTGTRLATLVERAVQTSWEKLYSLQKTTDVRQHDWHIVVTNDFKDAHHRIEEQVKTLREKAQASTEATHTLIRQEVLKMEALNENMLNRLNTLTDQHEAVQSALQDVVARQKDVKRLSQRTSGRVSDASTATGVADADMSSQRSTETPCDAGSSSRLPHRAQSSSDEASGLDEHSRRVNRKLKILTSKLYIHRNEHERHRRSLSRESSEVRHRMHRMHSGIHNAQVSAAHVQKSVTELELQLQEARQRQCFQEMLTSGIVKELVSSLKRELSQGNEGPHGTQEQQVAARALLWDMLSNHEK